MTLNHAEITKILSTVEVELLTASACLEYALSETNKTHAYKIRLLYILFH